MTYSDRLKWLSKRSIRLLQSLPEFENLYQILERRPVRSMLEIGANQGGSLYVFAGACEPDANLLSLDPAHGPQFKGVVKDLSKDYRVFQIKRRSQDPEALAEVCRHSPEGLDFLFIDGEHSYEAVKHDYETYGPLVKPGGIIAIHDINGACAARFRFQVKKFWDEIKLGLTNYEEIKENDAKFGIGVIYVEDHEKEEVEQQ